MPDIILKVVTVDAALPTQALARSFDASGGTIGRDDTNDLALPDKHRRVSRLHATISFPAGVPTITNSSTSLPISVGEQQLDFGESMPILHGAMIEVGPYILQAHSLSLDASRATVATAATPAAQQPSVASVGRIHTGMTVVLPPPAAANPPHAAVASASQAPQPMATSLPESFSEPSDLLDLLGGSFAAPIVAAPKLGPAVVPAADPLAQISAGEPAPFYVAPAPVFVAKQPAYIPPAPDNGDPFSDLLAGIGGTPEASPSGNTSAYAAPPPVSRLPQTPSGLSADPLAAFGGPSVSAFGTPLGTSVTAPFGFGDTSARSSGGGVADAFNPFDMPSDTARNDADPLSSLLGHSGATGRANENTAIQAAPSIDSLFQSAPSGGSDAALFDFASRTSGGGHLESLIGNNANSDPLSLFDNVGAESSESSRVMRNDSQEVGSAFQPPLPVQTIPAMPPMSPSQASYIPESSSDFGGFGLPSAPAVSSAPSASVLPPNPLAAPPVVFASVPQPHHLPSASAPTVFAPDVLTESFLRGAGLTPSSLPNGLTPEIMTTIGSLLRSATAGAIDMLAARAATKREVQASVTIISVQANNPLKFLPNADSALLQLLGKKMPGFMRADVAMKDAFEDLRAHEVGVIAGTRAALTEVLGKFDPAVLGDKLTKGSMLESLMPSARKAKLWDLYLERYLQIRREAEDDFQSIFGRAFVQAYELETARIKGDTQGSGGERQ